MADTNNTQVALPSGKKKAIDIIKGENFQQSLRSVLPKHISEERFVRVVLTQFYKNPVLQECTQESIVASLMDLAQLGLEADGYHAWLIPYWNKDKKAYECSYIMGYKGLVDLVYRTGIVANVHAEIVRANDFFRYKNGMVEHEPDVFASEEDRGEMIGAWCCITLNNGSKKYEAMSKHAIDQIRGRGKTKSFSPWDTDYEEMAKKTVFRRAQKWIPISVEFRTALEKDLDRFPEIEQSNYSEPRSLLRSGEEDIDAEEQSQ